MCERERGEGTDLLTSLCIPAELCYCGGREEQMLACTEFELGNVRNKAPSPK